MNSDILHAAFGISRQECLDVRCESNQIILKIQTPEDKLCCSCCGSHNVIHNGSRLRRFRSVPLGCRRCSLEMAVRRLTCKDCGEIAQEEADFAKGKRRHTRFFANMVMDLSRFATIQDISWFLDVSWDVWCATSKWSSFGPIIHPPTCPIWNMSAWTSSRSTKDRFTRQ
jgi:transposase